MASANRAIVERFIELVNAHTFDRFGEVAAQDYIQHNPHAGQGLAGLMAFFADQLRAMPDLKGTLDLVVSEGDLVAARTTVTGTRDGKPVSQTIADFWRVEDGKLKEHW